jgi:uncharacterized membrane protein
MFQKTYLKWTLLLTVAGTAFSGYLSLTKLLTGTCALNEACPYFLGYPACIYGFGMFSTMLVITIIGLAINTVKKWPTKLSKWWVLEFSDFVFALKLKLTFQQKDELLSLFEKYRGECLKLDNEIKKADNEIDQLIYKLHNLTPEEIKIVESV